MPLNRFLVFAAMASLALPLASPAASRLGYITIGPMFHWNFGNHEFKRFSSGLEMAYWNYESSNEQFFLYEDFPIPRIKRPGYGMAVGFEFDRQATRFYAEPQLGYVYAGASLGAVLERPRSGGPVQMGVQGSGWVNAVVGWDFRYRRLGGMNAQALGLYAKVIRLVAR